MYTAHIENWEIIHALQVYNTNTYWGGAHTCRSPNIPCNILCTYSVFVMHLL
jgi:hypothetical protein